MKTAVILFLLILLFCMQNNLNRKNKQEKRGFPLGKSKIGQRLLDMADNWKRRTFSQDGQYKLDNLPLNFATDSELSTYTNNNIYVDDQERKWNIYDFSISNGFYFSKYECKRAMIFLFTENWDIHMNFCINVNDKYIAPEKNTIYILKKGDKIYSTEYCSNEKYDFILLY